MNHLISNAKGMMFSSNSLKAQHTLSLRTQMKPTYQIEQINSSVQPLFNPLYDRIYHFHSSDIPRIRAPINDLLTLITLAPYCEENITAMCAETKTKKLVIPQHDDDLQGLDSWFRICLNDNVFYHSIIVMNMVKQNAHSLTWSLIMETCVAEAF